MNFSVDDIRKDKPALNVTLPIFFVVVTINGEFASHFFEFHIENSLNRSNVSLWRDVLEVRAVHDMSRKILKMFLGFREHF